MNNLSFRKSTLEDIETMVQIATDAKRFLKNCGVAQWQKGTYPSKECFIQDVKDGIGYVVTQNDEVVAFCAVTYTDEESYHTLDNWLSVNEIYATIHRSAVADDKRGQGIAPFLFKEVMKMTKENNVSYVRVDTHMDNKPMQHALEHAGFIRCGILTLIGGDEDGDLRYGYEIKL